MSILANTNGNTIIPFTLTVSIPLLLSLSFCCCRSYCCYLSFSFPTRDEAFYLVLNQTASSNYKSSSFLAIPLSSYHSSYSRTHWYTHSDLFSVHLLLSHHRRHIVLLLFLLPFPLLFPSLLFSAEVAFVVITGYTILITTSLYFLHTSSQNKSWYIYIYQETIRKTQARTITANFVMTTTNYIW